jgi:SAM-dependent methyltransferase
MFRELRHRLHVLRYSWRAIGPGVMLRNSVRWFGDPEVQAVDATFDVRHGTDTTAALTPAEAGIPEERRRTATMYLPTADRDLAAMMSALAWPGAQQSAATFVDLGSGKGRVVFLAAQRAFREVVGVELSPVLHAIAAQNLEILLAAGALRAPVRLVHGDATHFEPPRGPLVVYLYHPFSEAIAAQVIARLAELPTPVAILYCHPTVQPAFAPAVFAPFTRTVEGERRTRHFRLGWSIWTNRP